MDPKNHPLDGMQPDHVCIGVQDIEAAIAWYRKILGFEIDHRWSVPELPGFQFAYIQKNGYRIELIDSGGDVSGEPENLAFNEFLRLRGFSHVCFRVESVDAATTEVEDRGIKIDVPPTDFPDNGRRISFFRDLDGNYIEFAGPMKTKR